MKNKKSQIKFFVHNKYNAKVKKLKKKNDFKKQNFMQKKYFTAKKFLYF